MKCLCTLLFDRKVDYSHVWILGNKNTMHNVVKPLVKCRIDEDSNNEELVIGDYSNQI